MTSTDLITVSNESTQNNNNIINITNGNHNGSGGGGGNFVTELISNSINNRLIPKIGSIVKRFSLNYSGEGLVTDRERVRVVRVGIRFQVQVDSFLNNRAAIRPGAIQRSTSVPVLGQGQESLAITTGQDSLHHSIACGGRSYSEGGLGVLGSSGGTGTPEARRQSCLALDYNSNSADSNSNPNNDAHHNHQLIQSSNIHNHHNDYQSQRHSISNPPHHHTTTESLLNRLNALNFKNNQVNCVAGRRQSTTTTTASINQFNNSHRHNQIMEDSSSYHVLRHFPGEKITNTRIPSFIEWFLEVVKSYAKENPLSAITLFTLLTTCALPIVLFLAFAVGTIAVTFLGFLAIEGTLLTAACVLLAGVLVVVSFFTLTLLLVGLSAYFCTAQVYSLLKGHTSILKLLSYLPFFGRLFNDLDDPTPKRDAVLTEDREGANNDGLDADEIDEDDEDDEEEDDLYEVDTDVHDDDENLKEMDIAVAEAQLAQID